MRQAKEGMALLHAHTRTQSCHPWPHLRTASTRAWDMRLTHTPHAACKLPTCIAYTSPACGWHVCLGSTDFACSASCIPMHAASAVYMTLMLSMANIAYRVMLHVPAADCVRVSSSDSSPCAWDVPALAPGASGPAVDCKWRTYKWRKVCLRKEMHKRAVRA